MTEQPKFHNCISFSCPRVLAVMWRWVQENQRLRNPSLVKRCQLAYSQASHYLKQEMKLIWEQRSSLLYINTNTVEKIIQNNAVHASCSENMKKHKSVRNYFPTPANPNGMRQWRSQKYTLLSRSWLDWCGHLTQGPSILWLTVDLMLKMK